MRTAVAGPAINRFGGLLDYPPRPLRREIASRTPGAGADNRHFSLKAGFFSIRHSTEINDIPMMPVRNSPSAESGAGCSPGNQPLPL